VTPEFADSVPLIVLLAVLFVAAAFLAAAEAALLRVPRVRVEVAAERGDRAASRLVRLTADLPRVINSVLLVVLLVQIGAATIAGVVAERHFGNAGVTVASVALTLAMFVYAEAIPKTVAVRRPLAVARFVSLPIAVLALLTRPVVTVLLAFADLQAPGRGIPSRVTVNEAELRRLAADAAAAGEIDPSDFELIERSFGIGDTPVAAALVARPDVVFVRHDMELTTALEVALVSGHRRLPVCRSDLDNITGVVRLRDLAAAVTSGSAMTLSELQQPVLAVPETTPVLRVLREMQASSRQMAFIIDEHGGTAGIVTIEDLVEVLVGEIADSDRPWPRDIRRIGPGLWDVDATADVGRLADALGTDLPAGDWYTVAGLVIGTAGRIPRVGEEIDIAGCSIRVTSASKRRVRRVQVRAPSQHADS
jgi:putative hemolysin